MPVTYWNAWASSQPWEVGRGITTSLIKRTHLLPCGQKSRSHRPHCLDWALGLPLAGWPVLRAHPEPLTPSLPGAHPACWVRAWVMSNPEGPGTIVFLTSFWITRSTLGSDQVGKIGSAQPTRAPCQDFSHLVPPFLLGSQTAQAFGRENLNFLELLLQGIWHKLISPFTWLPFSQGLVHWFVGFFSSTLFL